MNALSFDTLAYARRMEAAGFSRAQAEAMAEEQAKLIDERLATKADVAAIRADIETHRQETKADIETLKLATGADIEALKLATGADIETLKLATRADIEALKLATRADIEALKFATGAETEGLRLTLRADMEKLRLSADANLERLRGDMRELEQRITIRLGGIVVVAVGVLTAVFRFLGKQ